MTIKIDSTKRYEIIGHNALEQNVILCIGDGTIKQMKSVWNKLSREGRFKPYNKIELRSKDNNLLLFKIDRQ